MNSAPHTPSVMVVDDEPANRDLMRTLLEYRRFDVREAADGVEALAAMRERRPDLLIADLVMPRMDGFELTRQVRSDERLTGVPVIFYTASFSTGRARQMADACGVQTVLYKPAEPQAIYDAVDQALGHSQVVDPSQPALDELHQSILVERTFEQSQELRALRRQLADLSALTRTLGSEQEPVALVKAFCDRTLQIFALDRLAVLLLGGDRRHVELVVRASLRQPIEVVAGTRRTLVVSGLPIAGNGLVETAAAADLAQRLGFYAADGTVVAAPLSTASATYGWVVGVRQPGRGPMTVCEAAMMTTIAGELAVSVECARQSERVHNSERRAGAATAEARASDLHYKTLFDNVPDGLLQVDLEGRIKVANRAVAKMFGAETPEELVGRHTIDFYWSAEARRLFLEAIDREGTVQNFEVDMRRMDGARRHILLSGAKITPADGTPAYFEGSLRDVTELREAENALARSEEMMRLTLAGAKAGVVQLDLATGAIEWGATSPDVFGWTSGELPGTWDEFVQIVHEGDRERLATELREVGAGLRDRVEHRIRRPDGIVRWIQGTGRGAERGSASTVIAGILTDITERKVLEDQLRQAQKMESIGQLAGGVAHDFNNLITAILGFAGLIKEGFAPDHAVQADVDEITKAGERAAGLTRQLLTFSRRQATRPERVDVNALIGNAEKMLSRLVGEDVALQFTPAEGLPRIHADPGQIEQVLMNLVVNARDAMPRGGRLTIETSHVDFDAEYAARHAGAHAGPHVMMAVSDSGVGMDAATQRRIFEPFFTTKAQGKGTGLGLSTVWGIVQDAGGHVFVYSEVGLGTTFKVYLPAAPPLDAAVAPEAPDAAAGAHGQEIVLLVEDDRAIRKFAKLILERGGYVVSEAEDFPSALAMAARMPRIDLLLTDVIMPGGGGGELFPRLSAERPELKVLFTSGYTGDTVLQHGIAAEDVPFLSKPFTAETLARAVRAALDGWPSAERKTA